MAIIYEVPGVSGEAVAEETGPIWYSPVAIQIPSFTKSVREGFQSVFSVIKPLVEFQKAGYDVFGPVLDSFNRKVDLFETATNTIKEFVTSMVADFETLLHRSGFYILITVPDFEVKRYIWLPSVLVVDNTQPVTDPAGNLLGIPVS